MPAAASEACVCASADAAVGGDNVPAALGNLTLARLAQGQVLRGASCGGSAFSHAYDSAWSAVCACFALC